MSDSHAQRGELHAPRDGPHAPRGEVQDRAPTDLADDDAHGGGLRTYVIGFLLAAGLTVASFGVAWTGLIWEPSIPTLLVVLAVAQIGVHLVFFLHIDSGPDSTNNVLALAFGAFIVILIIGGSIWIMANLNHYAHPTQMRQNPPAEQTPLRSH